MIKNNIKKLLCLLSLVAPSVFAEGVAVTCGASTGYSYYFEGGLITDKNVGFTEDGITNGQFTLTLTDKSEADVLFKDATGDLQSASGQGAQVMSIPTSGGGLNWLIMHVDGTLEVYAFHFESGQVTSYKNSVGHPKVAISRLLVSDCRVR